jgi:hypothetical protein
MADLQLLSGSVPANTPYPGTFNEFLQTLSSYLTLQYPDQLRYGVVSAAQPTGRDLDKLWFRLSQVDGSPQTVNLFIDGSWVEFTQFNFGDMVMISTASQIVSPWGEGSTSYTVGGQVLTTPAVPAPSGGFKYKVYVGNYQ